MKGPGLKVKSERFFVSKNLLAALLLFIACSSSPSPKADAIPQSDPTSQWPIAGDFDFPVGKPEGKGYYNAQPFGRNLHLGDDWNGLGGGNTDLGDSVFAVANGVVLFAEDLGGGWGKVLRIGHRMPPEHEHPFIESLYAHLFLFEVKKSDTVRKGDYIGQIGNADGAYWAHLHLEIRDSLNLPLGGGYGQDTRGYLDPTAFIKENR